jgi:two-component sensor histidine kinase
MTTSTFLPRRSIRWSIWVAFWTLLGLSFASQFYFSSSKAGMEVSWRSAVVYALADWYVFAILSIPVTYLARRFPFEAARWFQSLLVHLPASVLFSLAYMVVRAWVGTFQSDAGFSDAFRPLLVKTWHFNLLIYWVVLAVTHAFAYYAKFRERELHASELEKSLTEAKLQALRMQLNPHFLFNTLNAISALMHKDVEAADRMVVRLSQLLRAALDNSDEQEVRLSHELRLLEMYLGIEQTRFGDRLSVKMEIDPLALEAQVPNLVLQPLVENAIRHGIEPRRKPGIVEVRAARERNRLLLQVRDNGVGLPSGGHTEGVGLSNTRARLRELYGKDHEFELSRPESGGLQVTLRIPLRNGESS